MKLLAIVRIRGGINIDSQTRDTLNMLKLYRKNYFTVREAKPEIMGMLKKVKDYVAWGDTDMEVPEKGYGKLNFIKGFYDIKKPGRKSYLGHKKDISKMFGKAKK